MEKNKMIIIALIVVIVALLAGILVAMPNFAKTDSKLEIIGNDALNEGDNLQIKLTDIKGTALANQTVKITFTDKDNSNSEYSVVTNAEGIGELKLDKNAGEYNVTVSYGGNDKYNGCDAAKKITVEDKATETGSSTSSNSNGNYIEGPEVDGHGVSKRQVMQAGGDVKYDSENGVYVQYDSKYGVYHD